MRFYNRLNKMKYHSMNGHSHRSCSTIILKDYHQHEFWAVCEYHISSRYFTCLNLDFFNRALMCPYLVHFGNHSFAERQANSIKAVALQNIKVWLRNKIQFSLLTFWSHIRQLIFNQAIWCSSPLVLIACSLCLSKQLYSTYKKG